MGSMWLVAFNLDLSPRSDMSLLVAWGVGRTTLFIFLSVGMFCRVKVARWVAVVVAILMMFSIPVVGIVIFMYLIRPELDGVFA